MKEKQADPIKTFRAQWAVMTFYERFEQVIALALSAIIAVIIVVSLLQLISIVFSLLIIDAFNPLDHKVFQTVFGMIMTLLIAMEFKHSIVRVALRRAASLAQSPANRAVGADPARNCRRRWQPAVG